MQEKDPRGRKPLPKSKKLSRRVSFSMTTREEAALRKVAKTAGLPVSVFLRQLVQQQIHKK